MKKAMILRVRRSELKKQIIEKVMKPIEEKGFKIFFVGGCVRDELLGKELS